MRLTSVDIAPVSKVLSANLYLYRVKLYYGKTF